MKKKIAKLLALGMSIALVFSLAACGDDTTTEESTTDEAAVGLVDGEDPSAEPATGDETATGESESQSEAPADPNAPQQTGIQTPTDTAGIINLYNSAIGKAGYKTANVQLHWGSSNASGIGDLDAATGGKVKPEFEKPLTKSVTPGSLNAGNVSSASADENGNTITLTIKLNSTSGDSSSQYGLGGYLYFIHYNDALELLKRCGESAAGISISISEKSAKLELSNGVITATIDKTSGAMTGLSFKFNETVSGKAMVVIDATISGSGDVTFA